ncbi:hypothetical protein P154DRAFT_588469 [Amniculicola lignicola CBS 123094]|uniref:Uncharacterized protein n=1 Tax=Amniculicola lignicola CBS 123094 TaxID=1392246 RepID=A0A6A5VXJ0_9PLEO|nr:hypothetical protein P154DRAFT_588469 [Amniculicola lignicola CBS 123094]
MDFTSAGKTLVYPTNYDPADTPVMDPLFNSTDLGTTFARIAQSLTTQLRNITITMMEGSTQRFVIHVQVKWIFLTFPILLTVIGSVYVVLTIAESVKMKMPVWKGNTLSTLLFGFDQEIQQYMREILFLHYGKLMNRVDE